MGNPVKNSISTINPDSAVICPDCFINRIGAIKKGNQKGKKSACAIRKNLL